jgi:hypothetical protein
LALFEVPGGSARSPDVVIRISSTSAVSTPRHAAQDIGRAIDAFDLAGRALGVIRGTRRGARAR